MQSVLSAEALDFIPLPIRERLKLRPGSVLDFDEQAPFLKATPVGDAGGDLESFDRWLAASVGISKAGLSTDEMLAETRGED